MQPKGDDTLGRPFSINNSVSQTMNKQNQKTVFMHGKEYKKTKVQCTNKLNIWLGYRQHEYNKRNTIT